MNLHPVNVLLIQDEIAVVEGDGIVQGMRVVVEGAQNLRPGSGIRRRRPGLRPGTGLRGESEYQQANEHFGVSKYNHQYSAATVRRTSSRNCVSGGQ